MIKRDKYNNDSHYLLLLFLIIIYNKYHYSLEPGNNFYYVLL